MQGTRGTSEACRCKSERIRHAGNLRNISSYVWIGWHTGMARVGKVQPAPVPAKPAPAVCFTCTCTTNLWVLGNTAGTHKPVRVQYFLIFPFQHGLLLFSYFSYLFLVVFHLLYVL